jgi:ribosomal protein S18 acetylase RimI-like enzyme
MMCRAPVCFSSLMRDLSVHDARLEDARSVADIWFKANAARQGHFDVPADIHLFVEERMRSRDSLVFVAKEAGQIVGMGNQLPARESDGIGPIIPGLMHMSMIAVDPAHWGKGIGKALTEYGVDRATKLRYKAIQLWTHLSNERAQRLYTSVGFKQFGREKTDDRGEQIRLYVLTLNGD